MQTKAALVPEALVRYWSHIVGAAKRCEAVYCQAHLIAAHPAFQEFDETTVISSQRTTVAVSYDAERVVFTARGTDPANSSAVRNDCRAALSEEQYIGRCHLGGQQELNHVWSRAEELVKLWLNDGQRRLYCEGHSLGGLIAETYYARRGRSAVKHCLKMLPYGLVTFGKPHGGDSEFKSWVEKISDLHRIRQEFDKSIGHVRIVNETDVVARLPPVWLPSFRDYCASGVTFRFLGSLLHREPYAFLVWARFLRNRFSWHPFTASIREHSMSEYVRKLEALVVDAGEFTEMV